MVVAADFFFFFPTAASAAVCFTARIVTRRSGAEVNASVFLSSSSVSPLGFSLITLFCLLCRCYLASLPVGGRGKKKDKFSGNSFRKFCSLSFDFPLNSEFNGK